MQPQSEQIIDGQIPDMLQTRCPACDAPKPRHWLRAPDRFNGRREYYELYRCGVCSLVWLNNPPSPEQMVQHYGTEYDEYIAEVGETKINAYWGEPRRVVTRYKSGGALLDLGCSCEGFLTSLEGLSWELHGIEISEVVAARARARSGATVFVGSVVDAPFTPESFDVITCFHVLEHLYEPRRVLERVFQWLKPGGVFITFLPNIDSGAARIFKSYWYPLELPRHLFHFSPKSLNELARAVGLEHVALTTHREPFIELSAHYINDEILRKIGIIRGPASHRTTASLPWRILRKGMRLTVLPLLTRTMGIAGPGEIIHAVFQKPEAGL